ncbi:uncharacterized protein LOC126668749 [Mercurialis annua]|uniref:uncharacterized protein LOC126668749 n=1 Tax=Mercurialis annua TaxID=3986 RepID=UPI00215DF1B3|nr:uncharacterized protein LOC126668749 [Mercurialis annua]
MIGVWNIRGLNDPIKHSEVRKWIVNHKLSLIAIVETRVRSINIDKAWRSLNMKGWKRISNYNFYDLGRIWVIFKNDVPVNCLIKSIQMMQCEITSEGRALKVTFIYGMNDLGNRKEMWRDILSIVNTTNDPWVVLGDFNAILKDSNRCGGNSVNQSECLEFQDCLDAAELSELKWMAIVLNQGISDHSPLVVIINEPVKVNYKPFRFFNIWTESPKFIEIVESNWSMPVEGFKMYQVSQKLTRLKRVHRELNRESFHDISRQVEDTRRLLDRIQGQVQNDLMNSELLQEEKATVIKLKELLRCEENFYRQKPRVQWIDLGDLNTNFFS